MARTSLGRRIARGSLFAGLATRGARYARNPRKLHSIVRQAREKANAMGAGGALREVWDALMTFLRLIRAYARGDYRQVPLKTLVLIIAAVLYFLMPFDIVPDFFLALGYVDDAAVIAWVVTAVSSELDRFRTWESSRPSAEAEAAPSAGSRIPG